MNTKHSFSIACIVLAAATFLGSCATKPVERSGPPPQLRPENALTKGVLEIQVTGIPAVQGQLFVELYDEQSYFHYELVLNEKILPVTGHSLTVNLEHVPSGRYMVVVSQDANMNNKLDTNFFGAPTEAYGFSRGARGSVGVPHFQDGAVDFDGTILVVPVAIRI